MEQSLLSAAQNGSQLEALRKLRDKLAKTLDETQSARDIAPLAKRFADTLAEIAKLESEQESTGKTVIDEIISKRGTS